MKKILSISALFGLLILPLHVNAYKTNDQTAVRLTPTTAMYSISYTFGSPFRDMYLPIRTSRDNASDSEVLTLGYEILIDKEDYTAAGETTAIVFSNAEIVDNTYFIPAGSFAKFTLVGFLKTEPNTPEADYALKVSRLPFDEYLEEEDLVIKNGLTKPELSYYLTDEIELNE